MVIFKLKDKTMIFAEVVSDTETTNFCIASSLKSVIYCANELRIYYINLTLSDVPVPGTSESTRLESLAPAYLSITTVLSD